MLTERRRERKWGSRSNSESGKTKMEFKFPEQLFPCFINCGPPDTVLKHCAGKWGSYDRLTLQADSGSRSNWTFVSRHQVRGETWRHTEPVPCPLLSPKNAFPWPTKPPNPLDFTEHMQNFFMDHSQDAFGCMSGLLGENFNFKRGRKEKSRKDSVHMWKVKNFLDELKFKKCPMTYSSRTLNSYSELLWDVVHSIPPELLGSLLYEELTEQRERMLFSEGATGGALDFIPFSHSGSGFLIYPRNQGLNQLKFHRVELQRHNGSSSVLTCSSSSSDSFSFQLKGPIRQISSASLFNNCCVAVRSDHLCGVWRVSGGDEPHLLQVVNTREVATCVSASPHVLGEVLVASESGVVNLWTVGKGMQKVREEDSNMYFNANSPWRWCDFSAHPRVVLYADRTGAELTDIRVGPVSGHTLFRISSSSDCRSGERLILSKYLGDVHPFHHLVTTQFSAYVMDERFPGVPVLKWDHMMESPPLFCCVLPGSASSGSAVGGIGTTKVVLGSQSSQEITLLQYSGGGATACTSRGPPQALLRPRNSLKHLPVQIPHRLDVATNRLSSPAAGLTCVQKKRGEDGGVDDECICVLQLTEAGDLFCQILEPQQQQQLHKDTSTPSAAEGEPPSRQKPSQPASSSSLSSSAAAPSSQLVVENSSSDDDAIGPTQFQLFVAETPETEQQTFSDSDGSEEEQRRRKLKQLKLQVVVNDDPESDEDEDQSDAGEKDGAKTGNAKEPVCRSTSFTGPCEETAELKISEDALVTWKHWLQRLMKRSREKKPRPHGSQLFTVNTEGLLRLSSDKARDSSEDERVGRLRRDLRTCMSRRSILLHSSSSSSSSLSTPALAPLPNTVDTDAWRDPLSQRLTVSWQGEEAWRAWWKEELGLNRAEKEKALRRKRRREKEEKRAAGRRLELSGSFTSSINYQSELDSFSDSAGWTSGSQGAWSDNEGAGTLSQGTPPAVVSDTPVPAPTTSPLKRVEGKRVEPQTANRSCDVSVSQSERTKAMPANQRTRKRPAEGDHVSTSQSRLGVTEEDGSVRSTQSVAQRKVAMDLSTDSVVWSGFFQSRSLSQSSRGQLGPSQLSQMSNSSQSSQAKKKKPRMGF